MHLDCGHSKLFYHLEHLLVKLFLKFFGGGASFSVFLFSGGTDLDITVYLLLLAEAALALALLHLSGVLKKPWHVLLSAGLLALAFVLRGICLDYETLDYQDFLAVWVDYFRQNGGLAALKDSIGNYNVPYLTFLALFSQSAVKDLYLIKLLSIFFDVVLAWGVMRIAGHFVKTAERQLLAFFLVLLWPTVILNGALWGQCDSIYVSFAVLSVAMALENRPWLCVTAMGACFAFKLQAVFFIPALLLFLLRGKIQWKHLLAFPIINVILVLPAVIEGRGLWDALTVGMQETGSIGDGLNYNSPSVFAFFRNVANPTEAGQFGILAAALVIAMLAVVFFWKRKTASDLSLLMGTVLLAVAIPFFLPHMHDRYFYGADMFSLALGCAALPLLPLALLCEFASGLGYHAYLKMRYLLLMHWGSWALIIVMCMLVLGLIRELSKKPEPPKKSNMKTKSSASKTKKPEPKKKKA